MDIGGLMVNGKNETMTERIIEPNLKPADYQIGQELTGEITSVSKQISINFSGREIKVSPSTVANAREGEIRTFQIMDISSTGIVLKEVGNTKAMDETASRGILFTMVDTDGSIVETSKTEEESNEKENTINDIHSKMTKEDCSALLEEGMSLEKYTLQQLERALTRIKQQRSTKEEHNRQQVEDKKARTQEIERIAKRAGIDTGIVDYIYDCLDNADLPATTDNLNAIVTAYKLSQSIGTLSNASKAYLINSEMEPSIASLYKAKYSAKDTYKENTEFVQIQDAIKDMLSRSSFPDKEEAFKQAKWLFDSDLPVTETNISYKIALDQLNTTELKNDIIQQAVSAIAKGEEPVQSKLINFSESTGATGKETIEEHNVKSIQVIRTQRLLEETRLKLSYDSLNNSLKADYTEELNKLEEHVNRLKELEKQYYQNLLGEMGEEGEASVALLAKTSEAVENIRHADVTLLSKTFLYRKECTLESLSETALTTYVDNTEAERRYEALMTAPRADMGDSIQKAFQNVNSQLDALGLEQTHANQRAVRILGYNSIELTVENINAMKAYDSLVQDCIKTMTPSITVGLIKEGINPLTIPMDKLQSELNSLQEKYRNDATESYSEFLVGLDSHQELTSNERQAYIGIYRLLYQVEASDGAVIGSLVRANKELTFQNLLTEVRSRKQQAVDVKVEDTKGERKASTGYQNSISNQINQAFSEERIYADHLVHSIQDKLSVNNLIQWKEQFGEELDRTSFEKVEEYGSDSKNNDEIAKQKLEKLGWMAQNTKEAVRFLKQYQIPNTVETIIAAKEMIEHNRELYKKIKTLSGHEAANDLLSTLDEPNEFADRYNEHQEVLKDSLKSALFQGEINSDTADKITTMIHVLSLNQQLCKKEQYNIPVQIKNSIMNVNLTVTHGSNQKGQIQIVIPDTEHGVIKAELKVASNEIKAFITCNTKTGLDAVNKVRDTLAQQLKNEAIETVTINSGLDRQDEVAYLYASGEIYRQASKHTEEVQENRITTNALYGIAKQTITTLTAI